MAGINHQNMGGLWHCFTNIIQLVPSKYNTHTHVIMNIYSIYCIYIYIYLYIVYIHISICISIYIYMCVYLYIYVCVILLSKSNHPNEMPMFPSSGVRSPTFQCRHKVQADSPLAASSAPATDLHCGPGAKQRQCHRPETRKHTKKTMENHHFE